MPLDHEAVECTDPASVDAALARSAPDVVVNCAAFVRVDECEDRPDEALRVNALGALYVARAAASLDARCVYISSDYVFDGRRPPPAAYAETDAPAPVNVYGASKLAGEHLVAQTCPDALIVRTASLFGGRGARGKGGNFVTAILTRARAGEPLRVVDDVWMTPTYAPDAAWALVRLLAGGATGIVHVANAGACTWYTFARHALALAGVDAAVEPVPAATYPMRARRPTNSALDTARAAGLLGGPLRTWEDALAEYVRGLA
ncbi:MAG: dTDP-4-dehydrorhamnose reductase [Armatimonadota bacterium]|nr:dTDP-4-dehydrorhamnose reductase [Armatimonadota bacterium]